MAKVKIRAYCSPTLVLLAFDWPEGGSRKDFLGFAISRSPGYHNEAISWLPNRIGFDGPAPKGTDFPCNTSPIQKFAWWDARIDDQDRGKTFTYTCAPVVGKEDAPKVLEADTETLAVVLPPPVEHGIGTWFNRAVVSSQAFSRKFGGKLDEERLGEALSWLANGLETVIPEFLKRAESHEGAIYHFTDTQWLLPALQAHQGKLVMVINDTKKDHSTAESLAPLEGKDNLEFQPRTRAAIMHNKFLVALEGDQPKAVLMGSANFTTGGLTSQANLLHTFESPELAALYLARKRLLEDDPTVGKTAAEAGWSDQLSIGDAKVSVFFPPEPKGSRESLDRIVAAVKAAQKSVFFCLFSPTDKALRDAIFEQGDEGRVMLGLVNKITDNDGNASGEDAGSVAKVELYHRSRKNKDVYSHSLFPRDDGPEGMWFERSSLAGQGSKFPVYIHHKFILIDPETDHPTIFSGSANMSAAALYRNDENLLEIVDCPRLAAIYFAEFLRLYEHYRARAAFAGREEGKRDTFKLTKDSRWARKYFREGSPESKGRESLSGAV